MMPDFLIIGAQKCGTSSLADLLREDPEVFLPASKELHFFSRDAEPLTQKGLDSYERNFDRAASGQSCGEATPNYLASRFAATKVRSVLPDARLLVLVRDPIERAVSAFLHAQRMRVIPKSMTFDMAIERDARQCGARWTSIIRDGFFDIGLSRWLDQFSREQIRITLLENLVDNHEFELTAIYEHLGIKIPANGPPCLPHSNRARHHILPQVQRVVVRTLPTRHPIRRLVARASKKPVVRPLLSLRTIDMLRDLYADHILNLERQTSLDLRKWSTHPYHYAGEVNET